MMTQEMFQAQLSHIMGLLVESAVMEMGRLFDGCAAVLEGHENTVLKSEMECVNSINMVKFSSYMEVLSKSSVEQISLLLNIEEVDVTAVESSEAEAVISVNPEVKSGIVIIGQLHEIGEAVGTLSVPVKEERSSFESDNQEEDPDPRDVEWLPDDDPSLTPNINPISPSSTRPKTHRSLLDRAKQDPSRSEEDPDVQCGSSLICSHCGKCFKKKWDLTRHTQTHTKPYNCSKQLNGYNVNIIDFIGNRTV
ncbi:hypothetical protein DPEC_G00081720 [Dallia pectoralis]|uniref:Uncharacterized protein n=1 Tax=Dallia pectoralis TaxID=75939 RepID=A0ACC2GYK2_DALPE|nr:hypothetical protein DPEC_G00081720 [Dallia pectoralis]